jgi:prefoldin subunit 5
MFSDKAFKLLEDIPDRIEKGIKELDQELEEFDQNYDERKKEMDEFNNDLQNDISKSRLLRKNMKGCRPKTSN